RDPHVCCMSSKRRTTRVRVRLPARRRRGGVMKRLFLLAALTATTMVAVGMETAPAWAHATTQTFHIHHGTESFVDRVPCAGGKYTITLTFNAVFHRTKIRPHLF